LTDATEVPTASIIRDVYHILFVRIGRSDIRVPSYTGDGYNNIDHYLVRKTKKHALNNKFWKELISLLQLHYLAS
jgi:hypothetical protein